MNSNQQDTELFMRNGHEIFDATIIKIARKTTDE